YGVRVNEANVVKTDIECKNGVIHVIDSVLFP
nr:fasciclin domain-containing protein [Candidatus Aenigmarchaeota archaeon]NIS73592.1 fasciclin domain-containing protein [Candidatus Aenigmarchaeota archaeon]